MSIVTYVVEHDNIPRISLSDEIKGGKIVVVAAGDYAERVDKLESLIRTVREETTCEQTRYTIDDVLGEELS